MVIRKSARALAAKAMPIGTARRRNAGRIFRDIIRAREAVADVSREREFRPGTMRPAKSYRSWRRQHGNIEAPIQEIAEPIRIIVFSDEKTVSGCETVLPTDSIIVEAEIAATNSLVDKASLANYDLVLFLKTGSILRSGAIEQIATAYYDDPAAKVISFDSDLTRGVFRSDPLFRPNWSPDVLLGSNYIGRAAAFSGKWLSTLPFEINLSDRCIWEILLEGALEGVHTQHLSEVLLSERSSSAKMRPGEADAQMVKQRLAFHGIHSRVSLADGVLKTLPIPPDKTSVSIIVPTRHSTENIGRLVKSLRTTSYPDFELVIVDNGGESPDRIDWYGSTLEGLDASVFWWDAPFNYNKVNNFGVSQSRGDVIVLLNDDTEIVDHEWLDFLVGYATLPGVGEVGLQLLESRGLIQHGGVVIGPGGFADNLFAGLKPNTDTLIGPTNWYRNSIAVTGACAAMTRDNFLNVNGLDENFELMGSDVVLGIDQYLAGRRNVVLPFDMVRHYESLTRGNNVPIQDLYASYWRYEPWLRNGDPYVSKNVSRSSAIPKFAGLHEENPAWTCLRGLGRIPTKIIQRGNIAEEARALLGPASVTEEDVQKISTLHSAVDGFAKVQTVNWFIPDLDSPFFGGLNTAFRIANKLRLDHGVHNRFIVLAPPAEMFFRTALDAAFSGLGKESSFHFYQASDESLSAIPAADASVATLWLTAIHVAKAACAKRNFYLVQDYEPEFYPASSLFAMAEESYRLGLYGLCNTSSMYETYTKEYGGKGLAFTPAVDRKTYYPSTTVKTSDEPVTIFAYARDHFRNCWEIVEAALYEVKKRHGKNVRILAAGARYLPSSSGFMNLGLMDYREAANFYRMSDIGVTMQITRHPSYLPLELMASGAAMVLPASEWFRWLYDANENSVQARRSLPALVESIEELVLNDSLRNELQSGAVRTIAENHGDWDQALAGIYDYLCSPEANS